MKEFLDDMVSWASNIDGFQFALEIYEYKEPNDYTREKFHQMQNNFMMWLANLDSGNRQRLTESITRLAPKPERKLRIHG